MSEEKKREIVLWDCEKDRDVLIHSTKDEAIEYFLDTERCSPLPLGEKITVYGFARMPVVFPSARMIVQDIYELLDDDYNTPGEWTEPGECVEKEAEKLLEKIKQDYVPWACEVVHEEEVDVTQWVKENCPHWLEEAKEQEK